jgi:exodeoxyribonuclease VII large subunit
MTISIDLLKVETDSKVFQRGEEFYEENPNTQLSFLQNNQNLSITTEIKEYACKIEYSLETGSISNKVCTCYYFDKNNKICKHIVTLALQINHKLRKTIKNIDLIDSYEKADEILNNIIELNSSSKNNSAEIEQAQTVSQVTQTIKSLMEETPSLSNLYLKGEISNLSPNKSGHIYFSIKDEYSLLNCVMFKKAAETLTFNPQVGDKITLRGKITLYEPRGTYQLLVKEIKKEGQGDLFQQFLQLKNKLQIEGLFDESKKKKIPQFPNSIAVISSPTGAVIQDIINTVKRRFPKITLSLFPVSVQGLGSELQIIKSIKEINENHTKTKNNQDSPNKYDTIIIARGGGSIEDLWCFNDEKLAREISNSKIPVISAIGHETDFTICDFVADIRAPTPTAAAELATPNLFDLKLSLDNNKRRIIKSLEHNLENKRMRIINLEANIFSTLENNLNNKKHEIQRLKDKLKILSINSTLKRGFSLTVNSSGKTIKNIENLNKDEKIITILEKGKITSTITNLK